MVHARCSFDNTVEITRLDDHQGLHPFAISNRLGHHNNRMVGSNYSEHVFSSSQEVNWFLSGSAFRHHLVQAQDSRRSELKEIPCSFLMFGLLDTPGLYQYLGFLWQVS